MFGGDIASMMALADSSQSIGVWVQRVNLGYHVLSAAKIGKRWNPAFRTNITAA